MNIHRILQFGLKLIIPGRLWRCKKNVPKKLSLHPSSVHIHKSLLKNSIWSMSSYLCGLFSIWILMPEPRMGLIFMDSQKGNDHSMLLISILLLILHISVWCKFYLLQLMSDLLLQVSDSSRFHRLYNSIRVIARVDIPIPPWLRAHQAPGIRNLS